MVLVISMLCFVYAIIEGAAMLKELTAFRGKDDINLILFLIPILGHHRPLEPAAKVLEAKQMAGVPNPQVPHPVLYLFLAILLLAARPQRGLAGGRQSAALTAESTGS